QIRRDQRFAEDEAAVGDRERREGLAARQAGMDVTAIGREAGVVSARDAADRERRERLVAAELAERDKRKRAELDLQSAEDKQQLDKLRGMAQLDREMSEHEHAQEMAKRAALKGLSPDEMIAMQAAELAKSDGGGAAWAAALASRGDVERRHAEE